jgi:hypothetical protein
MDIYTKAFWLLVTVGIATLLTITEFYDFAMIFYLAGGFWLGRYYEFYKQNKDDETRFN